MIERVRIRCPSCRSSVLLAVLWASGDCCPKCATPMDTVVRPPGASRLGGGAAGRAGLSAQSPFGLRLKRTEG